MSFWARVGAVCASSAMMCILCLGTVAQAAGELDAARQLADSGNHAAAITAYSKSLNSGSLSTDDTAKGFYLRGVSYAKSSKNPQAISDLTNALWLTGLSKDERANAYRMRAAAYKASGLDAKASADLKRAGGAPQPDPAAGLTTTVVAAEPAKKVTPAKQKVAPAETAAIVSDKTSWPAQTETTTAKTTKPAAATSSAKSATSTASPGSNSAVSKFFSGIFGSGSTATTSPPAKADTPTVKAEAEQTVAAVSSSPTTAVSSWSSETETAPKKPAKPAKLSKPAKPVTTNWNTAATKVKVTAAKKAKPAAKKPAAKAAKKGRYNVQIATVREKTAAETILRDVASKAPKALAGLRPSIDEAVVGNMGTFYRVRVDGLPTRQASANLCKVLLDSGHDCFLIGR
ncbi:MAG: SPOR domain-containing protein [Hyphomicrobiaceae bacterium]